MRTENPRVGSSILSLATLPLFGIQPVTGSTMFHKSRSL